MSEVKSQEKDYYVYTHSLAGQPPFYVGKGNENRIKLIHRKHNQYHTRIVSKYGVENIIMRSMLCRSEQHSFELEVKIIAALRNGGVRLTNATDGGEGASGYKHLEETRAKISDAKKGHIVPNETRAKISKINKGRILSDETKAKRSGKIMSDETRAKISASSTGKIVSDESRAKMSIAQKHQKQIEVTYLNEICQSNNLTSISAMCEKQVSRNQFLGVELRELGYNLL